VEIALELHDDELTVGVATSGEALHKRPWRVYQHRAPLAGGLASALVALSGWQGEGLLLDPCCGSGTIPIEADHRFRRAPANAARASWPFERLRVFDPAALARVRERLLAEARAEGAPLQGNEQYAKHLDGARRNAEAAGVGAWATWTNRDFNHLERPEGLTHVVANPPWGLRVTSRKVSDRIAAELRARLDRWAKEGPLTAIVLVGNRRFEKLAEPPAKARDVMNGGVPCRVLRYEL
ncbi:MAG TPA: hypothetical protein VHH36_10045, partial [Candidatus Thermoplasmatota archaeon]|nr:hypothetical protein [Candidatus Thermoplasmatota archaeon]